MHTLSCDVTNRSDCILVYGSTTKDDVVKRSDCILVYGSTTKGDVVKRSDCICPRLTSNQHISAVCCSKVATVGQFTAVHSSLGG